MIKGTETYYKYRAFTTLAKQLINLVPFELNMICIKPSFDTVVRFNELPNLWDANEAKNKQVTEETFNVLGQLFLAYHVENIFGLTLLHNHFLLEEGEILLETGSLFDSQQKVVSQPVKVDKLDSSV